MVKTLERTETNTEILNLLRHEIQRDVTALKEKLTAFQSLAPDFKIEEVYTALRQTNGIAIMAKNEQTTKGRYSGANNATLLEATHADIRYSDIKVDVISGSVEVKLKERIWWENPEIKKEGSASTGGTVSMDKVEVDSDLGLDGDHYLEVRATSDNTTADVYFNSWK